MIIAWSQFKVVNDLVDEVRQAFLDRPRRVDNKIGFLGMEVFTDCAEPSLFHLVTRWTDHESYISWHNSPEHHASHKFIPKGLKLDPKQTRILQMERIDSAEPEGRQEEQIRDIAPLMGQFFSGSSNMHLAILGRDGSVQLASSAFEQSLAFHFKPGSDTIWRFLTQTDAELLRSTLNNGERNLNKRFLLNFVDAQYHPFTLECIVDVQPDQAVVLGERPTTRDSRAHEQLLELTNELTVLNREHVRQKRELLEAKRQLEVALHELRTSSWHLKKIQEYLPVCCLCHKVRVPNSEDMAPREVWTNLLGYLSENSEDFSHGLCPDCLEQEIDHAGTGIEDSGGRGR